MADEVTRPPSSTAAVARDGGSAPTGPPRAFPDDFPELRDWKDPKQLPAAIKGAADSLTNVDLSGGVFGWWLCHSLCGDV